MHKVTINGRSMEVEPGTTVLEAALLRGFRIPTLCHLRGRNPLGACRVCLVEAEGAKTLMAACSTPVADGMKIHTNSLRVRRSRRAVVELLLSEHSGDCQSCARGGDCELKELANELGIREISYQGARLEERLDESTAGLVRNGGKCIKCRRCVSVCGEMQAVGALFPQYRGFATEIGPAFSSRLADVACVQCGQCAAVCPVGAIVERSQVEQVWRALEDPGRFVVVQTAPAIRAALGECFDLPPGTLVTGKMVSALRELGFRAVFDTNFAADLTIMEEGSELLARLRDVLVNGKPAALPQFSSCSPGWINYVEHFFPEIIPNLSSCKSPQQMFGAVAKTYYAQKIGVDASRMTVVSIMPCTAKKFEAGRPEMNASGVADVDHVLTTRELGAMIKEAGMDFLALPDGEMDAPLGISSGAADIFANSGGVMEAALRSVYEIVTGGELPAVNLHVREIGGLAGLKEAALPVVGTLPQWRFLEGITLRVAVAHSLSNASRLAELARAGKAGWHFIEVMTCPGGCISGGGQPRFTTDEIRRARMQAVFREDEGKKLRKSHENPAVKTLYAEYLGIPLGEKSHRLLHTHYRQRGRC